jgi:signal transduction histidine kinase
MAGHLQDNLSGMQAFVANASHELRTPLTAIKLHVDALADGAVAEPEVAEHFLSQLQDEIDRMNRTITDLLDLSRIEANRGQMKLEVIHLGMILLETRDLWRARSEQAGIDLRLNLPQAIPRIQGNEDQLRRLFDNLVDNAIKHTPPGGHIELNLIHLTRRQVLRVEVRDNGKGIPPEHLPRIFERFYRVETPYAEKTSGSGLGLAIAKSIVESHDGKIGVTSEVDEGSTFWVEFNIPE